MTRRLTSGNLWAAAVIAIPATLLWGHWVLVAIYAAVVLFVITASAVTVAVERGKQLDEVRETARRLEDEANEHAAEAARLTELTKDARVVIPLRPPARTQLPTMGDLRVVPPQQNVDDAYWDSLYDERGEHR